VQSPEGAFNQSREMLYNLTGKRSPDIVLVGSCVWCVPSRLSNVFRARAGPSHAHM